MGGSTPKGVAGEEEDVLRMGAPTGDDRVGDVVDGVRDPGVLRDGDVVEVRLPRGGIQDHILQDGPEHPGRRVISGSPLGREGEMALA